MRIRGEALHGTRVELFTRAFEAHWAALTHHVECAIDDEEEVADLVAEVFALAWVKLDILKPPGLVWLLRVADNKIKDRERNLRARARAMQTVEMISPPQHASDPLESIAVRHALDAVLTAQERRIVRLFYWDRLSAGEIAELTRSSQAAVFTALSRARVKLVIELKS